MLKRIVAERVRRSKRVDKFRLEDDDGDDGDEGFGLTHRGKVIDETYTGQPQDETDIILSDDDDDNLDKVDTMLHFGGGKFDKSNPTTDGYYGASSSNGARDMGDAYRSRKQELEERILQKKLLKAEKLKRKEDQVETFETMDESFAELAGLLQFRDKERERVEKSEKRKRGLLDVEEMEMDAWDKEMKEYLFERKVKATDRTKTPEEIAKEEAEKLHELETRRLARMNGDFDDDDLSDISDDEAGGGSSSAKRRRREKDKLKSKKKQKGESGGDDLGDSDDEDDKKDDEHEVRFTADGLVYIDKDGKVVGKVGEEGQGDDNDDESDENESNGSDVESEDDNGSESGSDVDDDDGTDYDDDIEFTEGMKIQGNYHASEQYQGKANWYDGTITAIRTDNAGNTLYDVTYDDGDFEEGMAKKNVRPAPLSKEEKDQQMNHKTEAAMAKKKKQKAKLRAKETMPFVFEVPTTLDALHDIIATYATTGADASLIIQRIHATNSVRLNHKNKEKMQNFYDVLLRRFVAVGDAVFNSGSGGPDLERYEQLNSLTKTLYAMSQDSPECAGAVWSRRLGIFQQAVAKRLRDVEINPLGDACEGEFSAWPSTGMLLLMRALPHIFPSTDRRHAVVTPALLLLGQILAQTPVKTRCDVTKGLFCAALMMEYTKGAKRFPPEATAFLASVLRLYADDVESVPSLSNATNCPQLMDLREDLSEMPNITDDDVRLSLEKDDIQSEMTPAAILVFSLRLFQQHLDIIGTSSDGSEREIFAEMTKSLLCIDGSRKDHPLPIYVKNVIAETARKSASTCASDTKREPLQRRKGASAKELAIKTLAPRMEDPSRYNMSKDKGKSALQAEHDRHRREYKREHKAAMRELRLDNAFIEQERRKAKTEIDNKAKEKRHKNFAWLEQEQATMNQQVRMGGSLLSGGGIGAAKAVKAKGKFGIKKGGKF